METTESKETGADTNSAADRNAAATKFDPAVMNQVVNQFPALTTIHTATLGVDARQAGTGTGAQATGRVSESDLKGALSAYVAPDRYHDALDALRETRVVVLHGPFGTGKRTSALRLLRQCTEGQLILLTPRVTAAELATRTFDRECGYAIVDHVTDTSTERGFNWGLVRDSLTKSDAYLVVTTSREFGDPIEELRRVRWQLPDPELALRAHMTTVLTAEKLEVLHETLESATRIGDVVELARRLDKGERPEEATSHFDETAFNEVVKWFESQPNQRQILEVVTLAFGRDVSERAFDERVNSLEDHFQPDLAAEADATGDVSSQILPQIRHALTAPGSLITRATVTDDLGSHIELKFAAPGYRRHVVRMLWERYDSRTLWSTVRSWLDELAFNGEEFIATGLTVLSEFAMGEVLELIEPWSRGSRGIGSQLVSIYVLIYMAQYDVTASDALQIASRWINSGDHAQRWTAANALSSYLGIRYPHEAGNRLWQLCVEDHEATLALADLFVFLTRETSQAAIVLTLVAAKLKRFARPGAAIGMRVIAVTAALAVLSAHDQSTERRSIVVFLQHNPDRMDLVARVWRAVLDNRPTRSDALRLFVEIAGDLVDHQEKPAQFVGDLAKAISSPYTDEEIELLRTDFVNTNLRRGDVKNDAVTALLKILLQHISRGGTP